MASQIKKKYIADDAIDGNKILLDVGQSIRQSDGSGGEVDVIQNLNDSVSAEESARIAGDNALQTSINNEAATRLEVDTKILDSVKKEVFFETEAQIMGVSPDEGVPVANPNDATDEGWFFDKSLPGAANKINWYFHYKSQAPVHLDENGLSVYFTSVVETGYIFLGVYTSPEGDGNDASSWYRSRLSLTYNNADVTLGQEYLFWAFNEPSADIRPELTRIELTPRVSSLQRGPAGAAFLADGTRLAEMLDRVAINTDSGDSATRVRVYDAGIQGEVYEKEIAFRIKDRVTLDEVMSLSLQKSSMDAQRSEYLKLYTDYLYGLNQAGISQEVTDRTNADSNLQGQIDNILSNTDPAALDSLSEVVTAFQNADSNLSGAITRLSTSLSGAVDTEVAARIAGDSALQTSIDNEESARIAGDNALQTSINNEAATRLEVDTKILDSIKKEVLFESEAQIMGVAPDETAPIANPNDASDEGWFFDKSLPESGNKINWYFHYKSQAPVHLDENGLSVYFTSVVENGYIFLGMYTSPEGDGNDASSWYRSRLVMTYDNAEVTLGQEYLFWAFNEPSADIRPELTRVELTINTGSSVGPAEAPLVADGTRISEMFDRIAINTDSADSATRVRVYDAGIQGEKYEKEISFRIKDRVTLDEVMSLSLQKSSMDAQRSEYLKLYTDYLYGLNQAGISQEVTDRTNADSNLQSQIDNILSNTDPAALDSLSEIVGAFQQADSDLSGAITSLSTSLSGAVDTEVAARIAGDSALQSQIDSIVAGSVSFAKESVTITQAMLDNEYVDLQALSRENSMVIFVGRLALIEGSDYSVSNQGGVSRITFLAPMLTPSEEALEVDQVLSIKYAV